MLISCRDVGEGRLSTEEIRGTSPSERAFRAAYNIAADGHAIDGAAHETTRSCMFINCWNIGDDESARMSAEYTTSAESIAISTTFERLVRAMPTTELIISRVKYINDTTPRCEFFHTTPFFYKHMRFAFEIEPGAWRKEGDGKIDFVSLSQIKTAIKQLSFEERAELAAWLHGWNDDEWDDQMKRDIASGKLDDVLREVEEDIKAEHTREMP